MTRPPKKDMIIRARVPFDDYQTWIGLCEGRRTTVSEALRAAMADYARKFRRNPARSADQD